MHDEQYKRKSILEKCLLTDCYGNIADFEVTTENIGRIEVEDMFVHSNHFIDPFMTQYEKSTELEMIDSNGGSTGLPS